MKKYKARKPSGMNEHHLIPTSRRRDFPHLNLDDRRNRVFMDKDKHDRWHRLVHNHSGWEYAGTLAYLIRLGFRDHPADVNFYAVFGSLNLRSALTQVVTIWVPPLEFYTPNLPSSISALLRPARLHTESTAMNA